MSRFHSPSRARRRGQALLLAVLIMIFAALLSASFLVVVSVNLNQTARQTDKNRAVASARAGLNYINSRLTYSAEGDKWRSELESVPPAPGDPAYAFYYTPLDMAQGWARTTPHPADLDGDGNFYDGANSFSIDPEDEKMALDTARAQGKLEMVKSPDPRTNLESDPQYLSTIQRVPLTLSATDPEFDRIGALKITVIGLSSEDPTAYNRIVAYKGGFARSAIGSTVRFVSNWDFKRNVVPAAIVPADTNNSTTLAVDRANSDFSQIALPFTITLSKPDLTAVNSVAAHSAIVTSVAGNFPSYSLTLASVTTVKAGERIELAANLGAPLGINYSNAATPVPTPILVNLSDTNTDLDPTSAPAPNQVDGARVNGGLIWSGTLSAARLRPVAGSFGTTGLVPGTVFTSGVIAPDSTAPTSTAKIKFVDAPATSNALQASSSTGLFAPTVPPDVNVTNRDQLVRDGWNRQMGVPSTNNSTRNISDIRPPDISSGAGLERYRNIARFSAPTAGNPGTAALYGYGQGIYIDNTQDREKIFDTTTMPPKLRDMTQAELTRMWLSTVPTVTTTAFNDYMRTGTATPSTDPSYANVSLEQKHLRGWVGPDEFRARGVEIELGDGRVTITRDARDDATPLGASANQNWKNAAGAPQAGVYTRTLSWPRTGVIFAEGNVRIKGNALNVPNSLTVVSMGNIYIEDSLSAAPDTNADNDLSTPATQPRKILLMAKKNVVMNPTRVIGRPDAQTIVPTATTAAVNSTVTLAVQDTAKFRSGDVVETTSSMTPGGQVDCVAQIRSITTNSITASVFYSRTGNVEPNSSLRSRPESISTVGGVGFSKIGTVQDAIQRRFTLPTVPGSMPAAVPPTLRLDIRHQGVDTPVINATPVATPIFNVATVIPAAGSPKTAPPETVLFSNKRVLNMGAFDPAATTGSDINKLLRSDFSAPSPSGTETFPATKPTDDANANTATFNLAAIETEMEMLPHNDTGTPPTGWKHDVTTNSLYSNVPFFYLASVGNRLDFAPLPSSTERRKDILSPTLFPSGYKVPLATSINLWLNGADIQISDDISNLGKTNQFGFSTRYMDISNTTPVISPTPLPLPEDILTNDQSFYQPTANSKNVTVDSRTLANWVAGFNSLSMRQSENLIGIVDTLNPLPDYRLMGMRLEDINLANNMIKSGYTFKVNAFVYAQMGSWFVIPGADYETRVKGDADKSYYDFNANSVADVGEWVDGTTGAANAWDAGDGADLNRNGTVDPGEAIAGLRFSTRYNYQIDFTGAIAENQTALVNTVYDTTDPTKIVQPGAVDDWMNKWATTTYPAPASGNPYNRIHYVFDPTVVINGFQATDEGFRLPQTPDLFYQD